MSKRMLADVLWTAANERLVYDEFSCIAAKIAYFNAVNGDYSATWDDPACQFLYSLGCDPHQTYFEDSADPRGDRYMWLLLAMHVAEDEGITV